MLNVASRHLEQLVASQEMVRGNVPALTNAANQLTETVNGLTATQEVVNGQQTELAEYYRGASGASALTTLAGISSSLTVPLANSRDSVAALEAAAAEITKAMAAHNTAIEDFKAAVESANDRFTQSIESRASDPTGSMSAAAAAQVRDLQIEAAGRAAARQADGINRRVATALLEQVERVPPPPPPVRRIVFRPLLPYGFRRRPVLLRPPPMAPAPWFSPRPTPWWNRPLAGG